MEAYNFLPNLVRATATFPHFICPFEMWPSVVSSPVGSSDIGDEQRLKSDLASRFGSLIRCLHGGKLSPGPHCAGLDQRRSGRALCEFHHLTRDANQANAGQVSRQYLSLSKKSVSVLDWPLLEEEK